MVATGVIEGVVVAGGFDIVSVVLVVWQARENSATSKRSFRIASEILCEGDTSTISP